MTLASSSFIHWKVCIDNSAVNATNERTNERRRIKVKFEEQKEAFHPFVQWSHGMAIQRTPALSISVCLSCYTVFSIVLYILLLLFVKPLICS
jgi:hypothetical protein